MKRGEEFYSRWNVSVSLAAVVAEFYHAFGKLKQAREWIDVIFQGHVEDNDPYTFFVCGKIFLDAGEEEESRECFDKVLRMDPGCQFFIEEDHKYYRFAKRLDEEG